MVDATSAASVEAWALENHRILTEIFRQSAQELMNEMQEPLKGGGHMPIETGFLRASLIVSRNGALPLMDRENPYSARNSVTFNGAAAAAVIATAELGDTISAGYSANYAAHQEYGTAKMAGRGFVRLAVQNWPQIVARVTARAKALLNPGSPGLP